MTDPRIHERRVQVAREKGQFRRRVILASLLLAALVTGGLLIVHSSLLGARHVVVIGASHTSRAAVVRVAGLEKAPPLVDLSPTAIARRVESLPWVSGADVSISFPTTVRISVTERTPVADVHSASGGWALCDATGRVLAHYALRPPGFPYIVDPAGAPPPGRWLGGRLDALAAMAASMPESMVTTISSLAFGPGGVTARLADGRTALFGSLADPAQKFLSLATVLARADLNGIKVIDLRVPADPALLTRA